MAITVVRDHVTSKGHTRSRVKVHFDRPGHAEHFANRHAQATGIGLPAMDDLNFCDLEMTPQRSSEVKVIADSESVLPGSY